MICHFGYLIIYKLCKSNTNSKCGKCMNKTWYVFTCALYIRLFIETSLYVLLTSFYELINFNIKSTPATTSLSIAIIAFLLCLSFSALTIYLWIKHKREFDIQQHQYFKELYIGLKTKHKARLYPSLILVRKIVFAIFLVS